MRVALAPVVVPLVVLVFGLSSVQVRFDPPPGTVVVRELELEVASAREPHGDESCEHRLRLRLRDEHIEVGDHRPARMRRRLESFELEGEHRGDGMREAFELDGPLVDRLVRVAWDGPGPPSASFEGPDRFQDGDLLEGLPLGFDLHGLAPGREVEVGDVWFVDAGEVLDLLRLEELAIETPPCVPAGLGPRGLEGELRVELAGELEGDGVRLARLTVSGSLERRRSSARFQRDRPLAFGLRADAEVERREELRGELEGVVLWDLDAHRWSEARLVLQLELEESELVSWDDRSFEWTESWSGEVVLTGWSEAADAR